MHDGQPHEPCTGSRQGSVRHKVPSTGADSLTVSVVRTCQSAGYGLRPAGGDARLGAVGPRAGRGQDPWLNVPFFVLREALAFLLLGGFSLRYVYRSPRPDVGMLDESG